MQVPNFALVVLCALGKGGGKDNAKDNGDVISGIAIIYVIYC